MEDFIKNIIKKAGDICIREQHRIKSDDIDFKNQRDIVTRVDKTVEKFLIDEIRKTYPDHNFFGEETGKIETGSDYQWIIDPIDGTSSYLHGQPFYGISIAVYCSGRPEYAAVYAPVFNELFYATSEGAFLNGKKISVSSTKEMVHSIMATGFACLRAGLDDNNLDHFNRIVPQLRDIRRYGSAALDLCYTACGRLDGFWEMNLNLYDIAAGAYIVEKAGGRVTDFKGTSHYPAEGILATNSHIHPLLVEDFCTRSNG